MGLAGLNLDFVETRTALTSMYTDGQEQIVWIRQPKF